jgi:hypothetical protein
MRPGPFDAVVVQPEGLGFNEVDAVFEGFANWR